MVLAPILGGRTGSVRRPRGFGGSAGPGCRTGRQAQTDSAGDVGGGGSAAKAVQQDRPVATGAGVLRIQPKVRGNGRCAEGQLAMKACSPRGECCVPPLLQSVRTSSKAVPALRIWYVLAITESPGQ